MRACSARRRGSRSPRGSSCPGGAWDGHLDGAHPGVDLTRSIAVAAVHPVSAHLPIAGVAQALGFRRHQLLGELPDHLAQQVAAVLLEVLAQPRQGLHRVRDCHRISSQLVFRRTSEIDAVVVASGGPSDRQVVTRTPRPGTQLSSGPAAWPTCTRQMRRAIRRASAKPDPQWCGFRIDEELSRPVDRIPR